MDSPLFRNVIWPLVFVAVVGGIAYAGAELKVYKVFEKPCTEPITYTVRNFDERFGITRASFTKALTQAAALWNTAAGRTLVEASDTGAVAINLAYGTEQQTSQLGSTIDSAQERYELQKAQVERLSRDYESAKRRYESLTAPFKRDMESYDRDVAYWNARGGAPPKEYAVLSARQAKLMEDQERLTQYVDEINALVTELNSSIDELNAYAEQINQSVDVYNDSADSEFDQGQYIRDEEGERIIIREFTSETELTRVLAHEFGHALGLEHVENVESVMYSYNLGDKLTLTSEDLAELSRACEL